MSGLVGWRYLSELLASVSVTVWEQLDHPALDEAWLEGITKVAIWLIESAVTLNIAHRQNQ